MGGVEIGPINPVETGMEIGPVSPEKQMSYVWKLAIKKNVSGVEIGPINPVDTGIEIGPIRPVRNEKCHRCEEKNKLTDNEKKAYRALVCQLNWVETYTRPDAVFLNMCFKQLL